jgi:gliding motility-associated lipoprotein GldH
MKQFFLFLMVGICLLSFSACDQNRVFDEFKPIPGEQWHKDSLKVFMVPISDTLQNNNISINIRNNISYTYSNLWLFTRIELSEGMVIRDTFEMVLADPSGKWLGEGFGGYKTQKATYRSKVYFPHVGEYKITIQHGMRDTILEGISDIGLRIEKAE